MGLLTLALACAAAEVFLRLVTERETMLGTWFTPGIHVSDERFGFAFKPGYRGWMRHRDAVFGVPLALDRNGMRPPNRNGVPGAPDRVAIIGGRSMMFSFGLDDGESISGQLAANARHPLEVHNAVWVGFDAYRMWHLFRQTLEKEGPWKVAVIGMYRERPEDFADLPVDLTGLPPPVAAEDRFRFMDGVVIRATGNPMQAALGRDYYRSYLGYGLFSLVDQVVATVKARLPGGSAPPVPPAAPVVDRRSLGLERYRAFLSAMDRELAANGTRMLVVFLPSPAFPPDYYGDLAAAVPEGIARLDLQKELAADLAGERSIASGHYGREQARRIGARIAREVDRLIAPDESGAGPRAEPPGR